MIVILLLVIVAILLFGPGAILNVFNEHPFAVFAAIVAFFVIGNYAYLKGKRAKEARTLTDDQSG